MPFLFITPVQLIFISLSILCLFYFFSMEQQNQLHLQVLLNTYYFISRSVDYPLSKINSFFCINCQSN